MANNTDKPNPGLSAFSPQMRMQSRNNEGQGDTSISDDPQTDFPSLSSFTQRQIEEDRYAEDPSQVLQEPVNTRSSRSFSNDFPDDDGTFSVVNKVLVAAIIALSISIFGFAFTSSGTSNIASNLDQFLNDSVGRVAGVAFSEDSNGNTNNMVGIDVEMVEEEMSETTDLPSDNPEVLKVTNPDSFRSRFPVLYRDLQEGDLIFIYESKTIVYRPGISKFLAIIPR